MRNYKGNMLLLELIIVILFFSLSQLVVVRLFAAAHEKAEKSTLLSEALLCCEDVAERLQAADNPDATLLEIGFAGRDGEYVITKDQGFDVTVRTSREDASGGALTRSVVTALVKGEALVTLPINRYEAKEATP